MLITVTCPFCKAEFATTEEATGIPANCSKCGSPVPAIVPLRLLATEKQKDYARELGIPFAENIDRRTISKLIDEAVAKRDEERFNRLDELERREAAAAESLRLSDATTDEIVRALYDRGLTALLITMPTDRIVDYEHLKGMSVNYSFTDNMTMDDVESVILTAAATVMDNRRK